MSINERLAAMTVRMLQRDGFNVVIQRLSTPGDELDASPSSWSNVATVKALWDNPRAFTKNVNDGAPASSVQRRMTIAYRDDLAAPYSGVGLRVVVDSVPCNVVSLGSIGDRVGMRLLLDMGTEA